MLSAGGFLRLQGRQQQLASSPWSLPVLRGSGAEPAAAVTPCCSRLHRTGGEMEVQKVLNSYPRPHSDKAESELRPGLADS